MTNGFRKYLSIALMLISAVFLMTSGMWVYALYQKAFKENNDVIASYQTIRSINRILLSVNEVALDISSFIITGDRKFINKFPHIVTSLQVDLSTLAQLIQDNPTEVEMTNQLSVMVGKKIGFIQSIMNSNTLNNKNLLSSDPNRLKLTDSINQLIQNIKDIEMTQLEKITPEYQSSVNKANRDFILLGSLNVLFILISFLFIRAVFSTNK